MARAAAAFTASKVWQEYGYARLDDHARERFQRTGRWIRDLAAIGRAMQAMPGLESALSGHDGGPPLTLAAARVVAARARPETLEAWVRMARALPARALRAAARGRASNGNGCVVRIQAPEAVRAAFDEGLDLYRAVEGREASVTMFIEALVAEAVSAGQVSLEVEPLTEGAGPTTEAAGSISERGHGPEEAPGRNDQSDIEPPRDDDDSLLMRLLTLRRALERALDRLLVEIDMRCAWASLGFSGLERYAQNRLGMCPSTVRERARLSRALRRLPELRQAYERDEVGLMAALEVARLMAWQPDASPDLQRAWVERARRATVKRLRDEMRALQRQRALAPSDSVPLPLTDMDWHASLLRRPGDARARIALLARRARAQAASGGASVMGTLCWRLSPERANDFRRALEAAARTTSAGPGDGGGGAGSRPLWLGLLALIESFVETWDVDQSPQRPSRIAIYVRDGWRCMAPGCTSRRHLEDHHVVYRSQGGDDRPQNRVCLCRFHHQRGEHGMLARVRGRAPLGLVWSLGRGGRGGAFRNELRLEGRPC